MMRYVAVIGIAVVVMAIVGCAGRSLAGTYHADVRLLDGKQESTQAGYTLADVEQKLRQEPRSLVLKGDGRFDLRFGSSIHTPLKHVQHAWKDQKAVALLKQYGAR